MPEVNGGRSCNTAKHFCRDLESDGIIVRRTLVVKRLHHASGGEGHLDYSNEFLLFARPYIRALVELEREAECSGAVDLEPEAYVGSYRGGAGYSGSILARS